MRKNLVLVIALVFVIAFSGIVLAQEEEISLTVAGGAVGQEKELTEKAAEMYMEDNPNVTVEVLETPDLANDRLGLYLQFLEAESPEVDVYQVDVIWPGDLGEHFIDFYDYGAEEVVDKHFQAIVENNTTTDGRLVSMPWFTDAGLLYYRTDLLEKYDREVPETWDELEETARYIMEEERAAGNEDFYGYVWQGDAYEGLTCDALEWIYSNGGGKIVSTDQEITINNEKAIEIIDQAAGWVGDISPTGVTGMGEEDARAMFEAGNALFMRNWPYAYALASQEDKPTAGNFDVSPLPAGDSGSSAATLGGWNLSVSKYSEHPEAAAKLAMFLAGEEVQKMRAVEGSFNPTIRSLYEDEDVLEAVPFFGSLYDVFTSAVARPSTQTAPQYNQVSELFFQAVHSVLTGESDAQSAIEYLELDLMDTTGFETGEPTQP
ncbi:carbohydrate ABC transporter substrate-binding protein (CUT1 family) [Halanaerobium saccharolyticum]|uniref:Carbohydrate ABC transporter substrate-binding protein (CUT1 family) n=1 Tax=Halanaerobium saccharolyticum TaxID=43595 RepID=A0A4R7Z800_9FIRM|nr:ABC transporter substrate-binding protein [Halanaerobium saccharolyticum]RAK10506.1 carbohydrate ABC transporter substrate-binding protein (CUT1 family) [Halanaerobium saccharolyticum]TDW06737.1 carbohydrate ABC transporter substrate-binding protein (CUT1 family) [Halanaerobium saccharolyticum]TDX62372.1 carbohydrate ABC transporter substrate-binding protein (CUT1 family) [Halanaerobium saccharolyticum]